MTVGVAALGIQVEDLVGEADRPLGVGLGEPIRTDRVHGVTLDQRLDAGPEIPPAP